MNPADCEPWISPEEEKVLDILESAEVPEAVNDQVVAIVHALAVECAKAQNDRPEPGVPPAARPPQADQIQGDAPEKCGPVHHWHDAGQAWCRCRKLRLSVPEAPARPHPADLLLEIATLTRSGHPYGPKWFETLAKVLTWEEAAAEVVRPHPDPCMHSRFMEGCLNCALRDREALQEMVLLLKTIHGDTRNRYELRAAAQASGRADRETTKP